MMKREAESHDKRFCLLFLGAMLAGLAFVFALNYFGDGTRLFPSPGFPPSSCMRAWKSRRLESLALSSSPPRALVLGSSRVMALQSTDVERFTGLSAFNYGVSMGCPVDYLAQLRFALRAGVRPQLILLGVDEFAFGDNPEADFYDLQLLTHPGLFRELDLRERIPVWVGAAKTITLRSTIDSARNLLSRVRAHAGHGDGSALRPAPPLEGEYLPDVEHLPEAERALRRSAGVERLVRFWSRYLDRPDQVEAMRPTRRNLALFEEMVSFARERGIRVRVAMLPVHPDLERRLFTPRVLEIRAELGRALAEICARSGCSYRDFTALGSFDGTAEDFEDGTHMTPANGRRLLAAWLARPAPSIEAAVAE